MDNVERVLTIWWYIAEKLFPYCTIFSNESNERYRLEFPSETRCFAFTISCPPASYNSSWLYLHFALIYKIQAFKYGIFVKLLFCQNFANQIDLVNIWVQKWRFYKTETLRFEQFTRNYQDDRFLNWYKSWMHLISKINLINTGIRHIMLHKNILNFKSFLLFR